MLEANKRIPFKKLELFENNKFKRLNMTEQFSERK